MNRPASMCSAMKHFFSVASIAAAALLFATTAGAATVNPLHSGWEVQTGCKVQEDGAAISTMKFDAAGWIHATVPSTVLAAQVAAGDVKDPDYGTNLRSVPGTSYGIGMNYSNTAMPADSPYHCAWWYRKSFDVPASERGKTLWLRFGGMNYRANLWVNGKQVASNDVFQGAFTTFAFNVTDYLVPGKENVVAVETFAPQETDLAISWADWNPLPPDKEMGLWGDVNLASTGPVAIETPAVTTHFADSTLKTAELTVYAELRNGTDKPVHGVLHAYLEGLTLQQPVDLAPMEAREVSFTPTDFAKLHVQNPRIWWPWQMGTPNLESLRLSFSADNKISDDVTTRYGIREITDELIDRSTKGADIIPAKVEPLPPPQVAPTPAAPTAATGTTPAARPVRTPPPPQQVFRLYRVNGKPILIRGGGWAPDMLLRNDPAKLRAEFRMVRDMGLNAIRSEGKMESEDFFRVADENGVLVMIGWTCCDRWERWTRWTPENNKVALESLQSQILRLRNHPSVLVWLNGSDNPPTAAVESAYLKKESDLHWPNPTLSSATRRKTTVSGESGVKMEGPYDYVAPAYWLTDTKFGGAWGFATEIGPGPAIPTIDSMKKFLPEASIWPHDDVWRYHAGGGGFRDVTVFNNAMNAIYGQATDAVDYNRVSQAMAYDGERAMFEAYSRNKYNSTGVIQWMLNNAWPSVIWHLYDYYLGTGGGYFGTKKACEPLHVQYSYDDHSIWVVNSTYDTKESLTASASIFDDKLKKLYEGSGVIVSTPDSALKALAIPDAVLASGAQVYFVQLDLKTKAGKVVSRNFYWLPATASTYDWAKTKYTTTPILTYENLTALRTLPKAEVAAHLEIAGGKAIVHLHNTSKTLAFQLAVSTDAADDVPNAPVLWSDNYVSLLPGASTTLTATLPEHGKASPSFHVAGWNTAELTLHAGAAK